MTTTIQRSMAAGEVTPSIYGRADLQKYAAGLRECQNFIVQKHGGVANRPGTYLVGPVALHGYKVRLIPFVFNAEQTYVLEFGRYWMRVHRGGGQILEGDFPISGVTQANPGVLTQTVPVTFANNNEVFVRGVQGMEELNQRNFVVAGVAGNTFQLLDQATLTALDTRGFSAYTSGGLVSRVYTLVTPYHEDHVRDLTFVQSGDVITITHPSYPVYELRRTAHTSWSLAVKTFTPSIVGPTLVSAVGAAGANTYQYQVTTVKEETFEESLPFNWVTAVATASPSSANPIVVTWGPVVGAGTYNVYRELNGVYGFIGVASGTSFSDVGYSPNMSDTPPTPRNPFAAPGDYPSACGYYQQRQLFGGTDNKPEETVASRIGMTGNLTVANPTQDDDAVTFSLTGRFVSRILHYLDLGRLIVFTSAGEWVVKGNDAGTLVPSAINPGEETTYGASKLAPVTIGGTALYVQARGGSVRDLRYEVQSQGYRGNDLTIMATHLFKKKSLVAWAYQQHPNSVIWAARSDGVLLGLTYLREHDVWGWHRHVTDGFVEDVCVVPEGLEDAVYLAVLRYTAQGGVQRFIERMPSRNFSNIAQDAFFVDCGVTYDGRNQNALAALTLTTGGGWSTEDTLTATVPTYNPFKPSHVGNSLFVYDPDSVRYRLEITGYTSPTVVSVKPQVNIPISLQGTPTAVWSVALKTLLGFSHLEGKTVSALSDGNVMPQVVVSDGRITLSHAGEIVHAGLPYTSRIETLDLEVHGDSTLIDRSKLPNKVILKVEDTRGGFVGQSASTLREFKQRRPSDDEVIDVLNGDLEIIIDGRWDKYGRVVVQQTDPLPMTILNIAPAGKF